MSIRGTEQADGEKSATIADSYRRYGYGQPLSVFLATEPRAVMGELMRTSAFSVETTQSHAWETSIVCLQQSLARWTAKGHVYLEFDVPRLGRRIDAILILGAVVFVIEFKVGEKSFELKDMDQVLDYALDLKHFHHTSHHSILAPVLVATAAQPFLSDVVYDEAISGLFRVVRCSKHRLAEAIERVLKCAAQGSDLRPDDLDALVWEKGRYRPTPTIVEAALALYANHSVAEIARGDASNLEETSVYVSALIERTQRESGKAICFVTGVPGSGKTLVGLDVATRSTSVEKELHAVYLSGNGPLVQVLQEALAKDRVRRDEERGLKSAIGVARREVKAFIQSVHHFRDEGLKDHEPPTEHVAIFDEAQRAWDLQQTESFMQQKRGRLDFGRSEPEFLVSCLDRHSDWAVVVCLIGNGQEINTGEGGIAEWLWALNSKFPAWNVHVSPVLGTGDPGVDELKAGVRSRGRLVEAKELHLSSSVRSFRSERYSEFIDLLLDLQVERAQEMLAEVIANFPLFVTRDLGQAKTWLRSRARGTERYGLVVSSQAQRLRPHAIDVRVKVNPVHWFLGKKSDTRSSYYLEDAATEFQCQGLELDWACVVWDGDLRVDKREWRYFSFVGDGWNRVQKQERRKYLLNAYRVLLTRARQGTVIVIPPGDREDPTRSPEFYDPVYELLRQVGLPELPSC